VNPAQGAVRTSLDDPGLTDRMRPGRPSVNEASQATKPTARTRSGSSEIGVTVISCQSWNWSFNPRCIAWCASRVINSPSGMRTPGLMKSGLIDSIGAWVLVSSQNVSPSFMTSSAVIMSAP
jgi:hypothetical protein